jgi:hypothetical protein
MSKRTKSLIEGATELSQMTPAEWKRALRETDKTKKERQRRIQDGVAAILRQKDEEKEHQRKKRASKCETGRDNTVSGKGSRLSAEEVLQPNHIEYTAPIAELTVLRPTRTKYNGKEFVEEILITKSSGGPSPRPKCSSRSTVPTAICQGGNILLYIEYSSISVA